MRWWQGRTACPICGYGTAAHAVAYVRSVIEIGCGQTAPILPMQCPECGNFTLQPVDPEPVR